MENLASFLRIFNRESSSINQLPPPPEDLGFIMRSNGYRWHHNSWQLDREGNNKLLSRVSPLGYLRYTIGYDFHCMDAPVTKVINVLSQPAVRELVNKYRKIDENLAKRVSFLLGGVADRFSKGHSSIELASAVSFIAQMANLGSDKSVEAITTALISYLFYQQPDRQREGSDFQKDIMLMAEAIDQDPIVPQETADLGLSQALRLGFFQQLKSSDHQLSIPGEWMSYRQALQQFPTIGGEFHLQNGEAKLPNFKERLLLLNMAAYWHSSPILFSRLEGGINEIRMNPAPFHITIPNWYLIKSLVPEINKAFCTVTIGQRADNFDGEDRQLLTRLHALASLLFAELFADVSPHQSSGELLFGKGCFSMTVRIRDGQYSLTGGFRKDYQGGNGQLNLYTGFGDTFPHLAYYLSMATVEPELLESVARYTNPGRLTPTGLLETLSQENIKVIFQQINQSILNSPQLYAATVYGQKVLDSLVP